MPTKKAPAKKPKTTQAKKLDEIEVIQSLVKIFDKVTEDKDVIARVLKYIVERYLPAYELKMPDLLSKSTSPLKTSPDAASQASSDTDEAIDPHDKKRNVPMPDTVLESVSEVVKITKENENKPLIPGKTRFGKMEVTEEAVEAPPLPNSSQPNEGNV